MSVPVQSPRDPERRREFIDAVKALSDRQAVELFHQCDVWAATVGNGRKTIGVLNQRYDLVFVDCAPGPRVAAAYDTVRRELILARLFDRGDVDCPQVAKACADALGEPINQLECY